MKKKKKSSDLEALKKKHNIKTTEVTILQGTTGNTEWWTEEDWENHRKHVERLKERGDYMKPFTLTIAYMPLPGFDDEEPISLGESNVVLIPQNNGTASNPNTTLLLPERTKTT